MPDGELDIAQLEEHIAAALREDVGPGDLTSQAVVPAEATCRGHFVAREAGARAGAPVLAPLFRRLDPAVEVELLVADGFVELVLRGPVRRWARRPLSSSIRQPGVSSYQ